MMSPGHIAAAYLLSQAPAFQGQPLTGLEVLMVIVSANIPDLDLIYCLITKRKVEEHHNYFTHTPLGVFSIWLLWSFTLGRSFSLTLNVILLIALFSHLILDELGFWLYKLKLQEIKDEPQINWFYPFRTFSKKAKRGNIETVLEYFSKARVNVVLEIILVLASLFLLFRNS